MTNGGLVTESSHPRLADPEGLSAAWLFPVCGEPIRNGRVRSEGGRICEVCQTERTPDLPTTALLPATVNLHTHLELSGISEPLGRGLPLDRWVEEVIRHRVSRSDAGDESTAVEAGLREAAESGSTAVLDIAQAVMPDHATACDRIAAYEVLGLDPARCQGRLQSVLVQTEGQPTALSPHAPYSTHPAVRDRIVALSAEQKFLVTTHLAESPAERQLLETGGGAFADLLRRMNVWQDGLFGGRTIEQELDALLPSYRLVIAHGNDLRAEEYERLSVTNAAVAYCPRTHAFFGYGRHPVLEMLTAGVCVGLGTDSRASNPDLSVWNEVRFLRSTRPDIPPSILLEMATRNGAAAVGRHEDLGVIAEGLSARFLAVPLQKPDAVDAYEALFS